jgi:geranylgeranyl transferase type-2 subunit beta
MTEEFLRNQHLQFIKDLDGRINKFDYWQADCLRMNGIYWALTALLLLEPDLDPVSAQFSLSSPLTRESIINFAVECQCEEGGFGGNIGHDAHLTFTLSAIQILVILDSLQDPRFNLEKHVKWIAARQNSDGSFTGDTFGEIDTRFSYCAISALYLLDKTDVIDTEKALLFLEKCRNFDGGYGAIPGGESHAGQVFCCIGLLKILKVPIPDDEAERLANWLAWRQLPCGGLNGRPEKMEDVCYSWWVLSSLAMLERLHYINRQGINDFILSCQDPQAGGFSDRPGDMSDIFHTIFGLAGLSLLGFGGLAPVDARLCMPSTYCGKI